MRRPAHLGHSFSGLIGEDRAPMLMRDVRWTRSRALIWTRSNPGWSVNEHRLAETHSVPANHKWTPAA
jgi:hypothetical protein